MLPQRLASPASEVRLVLLRAAVACASVLRKSEVRATSTNSFKRPCVAERRGWRENMCSHPSVSQGFLTKWWCGSKDDSLPLVSKGRVGELVEPLCSSYRPRHFCQHVCIVVLVTG